MTLDMLTQDEQVALASRLASAGRKFGKVGQTLAEVALARRLDGKHTLCDPFDNSLWAERDRYLSAMDEMHPMALTVIADGRI